MRLSGKIIVSISLFYLIPLNAGSQTTPDQLLLKNFRPKSIYNLPETKIEKARFPVIDMHSHPYAQGADEIALWVDNMNDVGVEKTIILSKRTGAAFDSVYALYAAHGNRFEVWCGIDLSGYGQPGFTERAVNELERCAENGATGVGEISDKGEGLIKGMPVGKRLHLNDPLLDLVWEKCAELNLPVNIHVADPIWMYQVMDSTNDGLMNAMDWRLDDKPDYYSHDKMVSVLEDVVRKHPQTTIIACHFANCSYDLNKLGYLLDKYDNLYADISARYAETATIPRFVANFYQKYKSRLLYGTDMGFEKKMYHITFRILESEDEHFYETNQFGYHWSLDGFGLDDSILKRIYFENARKILNQ